MKLWILGASFGLFLVSLPLVSWGTRQDVDAAWYIGLGLMAVAAVLPPLTRFRSKDDKQERDDQAGAKDDGKGAKREGGARRGTARGEAGAGTGTGPMQGTSPGASPRNTSERAKLQKRKAEAASKDKERS